MHELSIVQSIVEIADQQVQAHDAAAVESIELEIGQLAGIEMDAFLFAWDAAVPRTVLANATRILHEPAGKARCTACNHEFAVKELYEVCPACGDYLNELIQGQELKVRTLTLVSE
jgi:hydrogenase nickel incorporation protein HypA/HybF